MNRTALSKLYAEHHLTKVKSTKGNDHRGTPRAFPHAHQSAPKGNIKELHTTRPTAMPKPETALKPLKKHVSTPYEEQQLIISRLRDELARVRGHHRGFVKSLLLILGPDTVQLVQNMLASELKRKITQSVKP